MNSAQSNVHLKIQVTAIDIARIIPREFHLIVEDLNKVLLAALVTWDHIKLVKVFQAFFDDPDSLVNILFGDDKRRSEPYTNMFNELRRQRKHHFARKLTCSDASV